MQWDKQPADPPYWHTYKCSDQHKGKYTKIGGAQWKVANGARMQTEELKGRKSK